jgi:Pyridine nucleotide-disulphide oxidoreductase
MRTITRRSFTKLAASVALASVAGACATMEARPKVVVIGGGFGGATAARYLRALDPGLDVTLVEPARDYYTCPFSNLVLGGVIEMPAIRHGYDGLAKLGVRVVQDSARAIDAARKTVTLAGGSTLAYDRLIVAPGIDVRFDATPGYDEAASELIPHAWRAGPQTVLLRRQLEAMENGGLVIMSVPTPPFRCPPGPYERASMIAHYLKTRKPRSKLLILDSNDSFSKQPLFMEGWNKLYGGLIEWVKLSADGKVARVDASAMTVTSDFGKAHKGAVINFIPARGPRGPLRLVSRQSHDVRVDPGAGRARHRRRFDCGRHAEIRFFRQQPGKDRGQRHHRQPRRTPALAALARQYLLQFRRARLWHLDCRGLPGGRWQARRRRGRRRCQPRQRGPGIPLSGSALRRGLVRQHQRR